MKVFVFVEGQSDRLALETLWNDWRRQLRDRGHGISLIALDGKSKLLRKIGPRAAEKLVANGDDLVVGLPDLYPNTGHENSGFRHEDLSELQSVQSEEVRRALSGIYKVGLPQADALLQRFFPSALKHDMEMLLLAAVDELRNYLRTREKLDRWRHPVEDQNQQHPPKHIVEELFQTKKRERYRDTRHAPAVLRTVSSIRDLMYSEHNQLECPVFKEMLDWVSGRTGVRAYQ